MNDLSLEDYVLMHSKCTHRFDEIFSLPVVILFLHNRLENAFGNYSIEYLCETPKL